MYWFNHETNVYFFLKKERKFTNSSETMHIKSHFLASKDFVQNKYN